MSTDVDGNVLLQYRYKASLGSSLIRFLIIYTN